MTGQVLLVERVVVNLDLEKRVDDEEEPEQTFEKALKSSGISMTGTLTCCNSWRWV